MLVFVRSFVFNLVFFTTVPLIFILSTPLLLRRSPPFVFAKYSTRYCLWLAKVIAGISYKVEGLEHVPDGACIFASKHQSFWETFALQALFPEISIVYKIELSRIPVYGAFVKKLNGIAVDRANGKQALRDLQEMSKQKLQSGLKVLIFPEGTRSAVGQPASYQKGVYFMYKDQPYPVIPIALNSGLFWPRRSWLKYPGVITIKFLPALQPGLKSHDFMAQLESGIEDATRLLVSQGQQNQRNKT